MLVAQAAATLNLLPEKVHRLELKIIFERSLDFVQNRVCFLDRFGSALLNPVWIDVIKVVVEVSGLSVDLI